MVLMAISLIKAIWNDGRRERAGIPTTIPEAATETREGAMPAE